MNSNQESLDILTAPQVAQMLGYTRQHLTRLARSGVFENCSFLSAGGHWRFIAGPELDAAIKQLHSPDPEGNRELLQKSGSVNSVVVFNVADYIARSKGNAALAAECLRYLMGPEFGETPSFPSQRAIAKHYGVSAAAVCKRCNNIRRRFRLTRKATLHS